MKSKTHVVIDSAKPHGTKRFFHHLKGVKITCSLPVTQEENQIVRCREFRRPAKASMTQSNLELNSSKAASSVRESRLPTTDAEETFSRADTISSADFEMSSRLVNQSSRIRGISVSIPICPKRSPFGMYVAAKKGL